MNPIKQITATTEANVTMTADGCDDLPILHTGQEMVSTWQLSPAEIAEVQRTGKLHLVVYGAGHPPVMLTAYEQHIMPFTLPPGGEPINEQPIN